LPQGDNEGATSALYERSFDANVPNIALLNLFFTQMPKGGDLHHHYSGSIYAETYLEWVKNKHWYIDSCTFKIVPIKNSDGCKALSVDELIANDTLYRKLLTLWSIKTFPTTATSNYRQIATFSTHLAIFHLSQTNTWM